MRITEAAGVPSYCYGTPGGRSELPVRYLSIPWPARLVHLPVGCCLRDRHLRSMTTSRYSLGSTRVSSPERL